jgi:maltose/moltooligosaccharide transporter
VRSFWSLFVLQKATALEATAGNGVPYWMYVCFMIGTVCILLTVLTAMARTREPTLSDEELEETRSAPKGLHHAVKEIADAVASSAHAARHHWEVRRSQVPSLRPPG